MLFNSFAFFIFFPAVTLLYFVIPHAYRWLLLLVASCFFYMFYKPVYILILFALILVDYWAGILIESSTGQKRANYLYLSLAANIGILCFFKYADFFLGNLNVLFSLFHINATMPLLELLLPIGLSFHTFQAMSYTIEVYQGKQPAERHLGIYALYVMFYPQLVAGPIERPQHLIHQFKVKHVFDYENAANGLRQMVWGLYKKSVIADNIAAVIDPVFVYPQRYSATVLAISACFFMFQLYCDFSGYSDIAIGCARVMGFRLMVNFNHPFRARSVADYWRRWHISLTTWFRDYVFIPLGGNKVGSARLIINLMLVFVLSGFWHGASWNFLIWGGINGLLYILSAFITGKLRLKGHSTIMARLSQVGTFSLIVLNHIYFRSKDLGDANYIFSKIFTAGSEWVQAIQKPSLWSELVFNHFSIIKSLICFCLILLLELVHHLEGEGHIFELIARKKLWVRWGVYIFVFTQIYMSGVFNSRQFLYFQF